jgi:hypothetical protein
MIQSQTKIFTEENINDDKKTPLARFSSFESSRKVNVHFEPPKLISWTNLLWIFLFLTLIVSTTGLAIFFIFYYYSSVYYFDKAFLGGPDQNVCNFENNPSQFIVTTKCSEETSIEIISIPKTNWSEVTFFSKDQFWIENGGGKISAFHIFSGYNNPSIIVLHGFRSCKNAQNTLLISGYLWKAGYNVLIIDQRNHGQSDHYKFQKPYITYGSEEHKDVLGGVDYLRKFYNTSIGVYGISMVIYF